MSGSGGGGGYEYQARAAAFICTHILVQRPLNWVEHICLDTPTAISQETLGAGDDIQIVLHDQTVIELQVKHGLQKDKLWEALIPLAKGLTENSLLYEILLTDSTASGTIRDGLRRDLVRLGQGREDNLKPITQEFLQRLRENGVAYDAQLFRRLRIIVLDLDDELRDGNIGQIMLSQAVSQSQVKQAWAVLIKDCFSMITNRGRRDCLTLAQLLSSHAIQVSAIAENSTLHFEKYRTYLVAKTAQFVIPGLGKTLSIQQDWILLNAKRAQGDRDPFNADLLPSLYSRTLIVGHSGSGKSTLLRRLAHNLANLSKRVLLVRLPDVLRLWRSQQSGKTFNDAILDVATDGLNVESSHLRSVLNAPDYLLADGLDECEHDRAGIAEQISAWAEGHPTTKVILTNRIGYELELPKEWISVELQPLSRDEIQDYGIRLITASSDPLTTSEHLAAWEKSIQNEKIRSLAVNTPLLLGFIIQLLISGIAINQTSRASLYKAIIKLACGNSAPHRKSIHLSQRSAMRILELSGWKLLHQPSITEDELIEFLIQTLEERGFSTQQAEYEAEQGLAFWKTQCLLESSRVGHQRIVSFVHSSLCEYAAGQYATRLNEPDLRTWIEMVRRDPRWAQTIYFAADLGLGETIAQYLLELDQPEDLASREKTLAVAVCAETEQISSELLAKVVHRIQPQLEASSAETISEATEALLSIAAKVQPLIAQLSSSLLSHACLWTRVAALSLALASDQDSISDTMLEETLEQALSESLIPAFPFTLSSTRRSKSSEWEIRDQVILPGCELLLQRHPKVETAERILEWLSDGSLSSGTDEKIRKLLLNHTLEAWRSPDELDKKAWATFLQKLRQSQRGFRGLVDSLQSQYILREIERVERTKRADKAFLEAILRLGSSPMLPPQTQPDAQPLITLGILFKGMGWWRMPTIWWDKLGDCEDLEALDIVFRGMVAVLDLDLQSLSMESMWALKDVERFFTFDLTCIKTELQAEQNTGRCSEKYLDVLQNWQPIQEDPTSLSLCCRLPKVPSVFHWQQAERLQLSPNLLARALEHSSDGICQNAALLIKYGAGGTEAIALAKEIVGEEAWREFAET